MVDFSGMPLGRRPALPARLSRRVALAQVFPSLPTPAAARSWNSGETKRSSWGNDQIGDCTAATEANTLTSVFRAVYGHDPAIPQEVVTNLYIETGAYNPAAVQPDGFNPTDQGAIFEDVTKYVLANGFAGHRLLGSLAVNAADIVNIKRGIDFFGAGAFGFQLPVAWQKATEWNLNGYAPGSPDWALNGWGGHEVGASDYDETGVWVWTWGSLVHVTYDALAVFCDEIDILLWASWIRGGMTPVGVSLDTLEGYMAAMAA